MVGLLSLFGGCNKGRTLRRIRITILRCFLCVYVGLARQDFKENKVIYYVLIMCMSAGVVLKVGL